MVFTLISSISRASMFVRWVLKRQLHQISGVKEMSTLNGKESFTDSSRLLSKLLREPDSRLKSELDLEHDSKIQTNASFWVHLVSALRFSSPMKAHLVLEWKLERLLKENSGDQSHYAELISLCGKVPDISFAIQVFTSMEGRGIMPNVFVFNSLISACLLAGNIVTPLSLFEIMVTAKDCKPDMATYNAFISAYSKMGDANAMEAWYLAEKEAGYPPDISTYDSLIAGFINAGRFSDADTLYEEMILRGMAPNEGIVVSILESMRKQKKVGDIPQFLKLLEDRGWDLTELMIEKILKLYSELGKIEEMEALLISLKLKRNSSILSRVHCGIIRLHASWDRIDDMENSIRRMLKEGISFTCHRDIEVIICSYFRKAAFERLDLFLDQMRGSFTLPKSTYDLLVAGYRRAGLYDKLNSLVEDIKNA